MALLATIPFLGKAFHVDDTLYLAVARQILVRPWDPFGAEILWEKAPESLFDADFNPPLWSYLLAGVIACTGEPTVTVREVGVNEQGTPVYQREEPSRLPELATHGLESVFMGAAIAALYMLSRRWVRWPLAATALIALSPAVLPGQNIMLEGPGSVSTIAVDAPLATPHGVASGPDGTIYVADMKSHRVLAIDASGHVTTVAGTGQPGSLAQALNRPAAVLVHAGWLWIADLDNHRISAVPLE